MKGKLKDYLDYIEEYQNEKFRMVAIMLGSIQEKINKVDGKELDLDFEIEKDYMTIGKKVNDEYIYFLKFFKPGSKDIDQGSVKSESGINDLADFMKIAEDFADMIQHAMKIAKIFGEKYERI